MLFLLCHVVVSLSSAVVKWFFNWEIWISVYFIEPTPNCMMDGACFHPVPDFADFLKSLVKISKTFG